MEYILHTVSIAVLAIAGAQMLTLLARSWSNVTAMRRDHLVDSVFLQERLASAAMTRRAQQAALDHGWSGLRKFKIDRKVFEGGGIFSFYLVAHDGAVQAIGER